MSGLQEERLPLQESIAQAFSKEESRRDFLRQMFWGTCLAFSKTTSVGYIPSLKRVSEFNSRDVVQDIKTFEAEVGSNRLTPQQITNFLPLVVELFAREMHPNKSVNELVNSIYFVDRDFESRDEAEKEYGRAVLGKSSILENSPIIRQLRQDYPRLRLTEKDADEIIVNMAMAGKGWVSSNLEKLFLVRDRVNSGGKDTEGETPLMQYSGFGPTATEEPLTPVTNIRSTTIHVMTHLNADLGWHGLNSSFVRAYESAYNTNKGIADRYSFPSGEKSSLIFKLDISRTIGDAESQPRLDELVTEYLATRVSNKHNLPYESGYEEFTPVALANLGLVLEQAQIGYDELIDLHRNSKLETFLIRVAQGAQGITFANDFERLVFGMKLIIPKTISEVFAELKPHYPRIIT